MNARLNRSKLTVRRARPADIPAIVDLSERVFGNSAATAAELRSQQRHFPQGQFIVEFEGDAVGFCATMRVDEDEAMSPHSWDEITANGHAVRHKPNGEFLYGIEVCVDPHRRRLRIGQRLYDERRRLCEDLGLRGIVFGGRIPGYGRRRKSFASPEDYILAVTENRIRDQVLNFQLRNGFEAIGALPNYLPEDKESLGYAAHMVWWNPYYRQTADIPNNAEGLMRDHVRVACIQFQARKVASFEEFISQLDYFIKIAADYRSDFVMFPELVTLPLLSAEGEKLNAAESILRVAEYTDKYVDRMSRMAIANNINIIAGTQPTLTGDGAVENVAYVCLRDGAVHAQPKLHPTPTERTNWHIKGGNSLGVIDTDCGPIGVLICYDSEFPEAARLLADQGALLLFVPYCTDLPDGHNRVRYCCQARAIENQIYVATAGMVGNLPDTENMDINYAQTAIYTPCDFPFARDGIAATCAPNAETIVFADLRLDDLMVARNSGTVQNLRDRRFDLYQTHWPLQRRGGRPQR